MVGGRRRGAGACLSGIPPSVHAVGFPGSGLRLQGQQSHAGCAFRWQVEESSSQFVGCSDDARAWEPWVELSDLVSGGQSGLGVDDRGGLWSAGTESV